MPGLRLLQHQWENALWILAAEVEDECCLSVDHLQVSVHPKQQLGHQDQQFLLVEMGVLPVPLLRAFFFWLYGPVLSALSFGCRWVGRKLQPCVQHRRQVLEGLQHLAQGSLLAHLPILEFHDERV